MVIVKVDLQYKLDRGSHGYSHESDPVVRYPQLGGK
jgi:hypothetical protein